ncbi:FkbM family methyltransferase [Devosia sp. RR2S18]|uniref:FkbM family methyltransferase n=1 Tax=Devosia rhizosphaerae TaxID=3049774 RepID=UPI00253F98C8|nr:FkbM family methyltransferase [Devosia sp. RR2S18]WIJ23910.1 FkbM family methyltransferase [Devosia sp. RR2S18]
MEPKRPLIRIGGSADGAYLLPDDLEDISCAFSPGVGAKSLFEYELAERNMKVFMADYSVSGPAMEHPNFRFVRRYLGSHVSPVHLTLTDWVKQTVPETASEQDLLIQMDIEGSEYEVLANTPIELLSRFRHIVVEFHDLGELFGHQRHSLMRLAFERLLQNHRVTHIHPNNCCGVVKFQQLEIPDVMEFTFSRKDRLTGAPAKTSLPHPLDIVNVPERPALTLPQCWAEAATVQSLEAN